MQSMPDEVEFEWDQGNLHKSYEKHGISPREVEEVFAGEGLRIIPDVKHSQKEDRYIALGKDPEGRRFFVVFTFRGMKVRVVSARRMHGKEVRKYEAKKDTAL